MRAYIPIDRSARCQIRTVRTLVPSQQSAQGQTPLRIPAHPLRGRRWLRILNFGLDGDPSAGKFVVIGGSDVRWPDPLTPDIWGYGLGRLEAIDLPIEDGVDVFCVADPSLLATQSIDLRTIELA